MFTGQPCLNRTAAEIARKRACSQPRASRSPRTTPGRLGCPREPVPTPALATEESDTLSDSPLAADGPSVATTRKGERALFPFSQIPARTCLCSAWAAAGAHGTSEFRPRASVRPGSPETTACSGSSSASADRPQPCAPLSCMDRSSPAGRRAAAPVGRKEKPRDPRFDAFAKRPAPGVGSSQAHIVSGAERTSGVSRKRGGTVLKPIADRWRAWRAPQARQARKAQRRRNWHEALSEADSRARSQGPSPTEVYTRRWKNTKR
jgi:hypothetical protein